MQLPPFLTQLQQDGSQKPISAVYHHTNRVIGDGHVLCYFPKDTTTSPPLVLYFIPGNPGQADYYRPFMKKLHEMQPDAVIVSQAHLGHTPNLTGDATPLASTSLASQMESAFDMVDSLRASYPKAKLVVAGHSIGGWMSLQAMKATPTVVDAVFLITPTISNLATTPNGQSLTWLFWPISAAVAGLASPILGVMPFPFFSLCLGSHWPRDQLAVIKSMLLHPKATVAALYMARDEMDTVKTLDIATLQAYNDRIYTYYATNDDWVGDEKPAIIEILGRTERLYEDTSDTPHSFCITDRHSLRVATQCSRWMDMLREHGAHDQAR